jgi:hypothetical protein
VVVATVALTLMVVLSISRVRARRTLARTSSTQQQMPLNVNDRVSYGMRARPLRADAPDLDQAQRAWMDSLPDRCYDMVRIVVSFSPREHEAVTRAVVDFTAEVVPPATSPNPPIIWSLFPQRDTVQSSRSTTISVGAKLKILDVSRQTEVQGTQQTLRILGTGELQPRATWTITGSAREPIEGDQEFLVVVERPGQTLCSGTLRVGFELSRQREEIRAYYTAGQPQTVAAVQLT